MGWNMTVKKYDIKDFEHQVIQLRDLFIPRSLEVTFPTFEGVTYNSPSQRGHIRRIVRNVLFSPSHTIHVWYIYLHLVDFYGKCR